MDYKSKESNNILEKDAKRTNENNNNYKVNITNFEINRKITCPFLIRVFFHENEYNSLDEYRNGKLPSNELNIHTWMDATLRELTNLIQGILKMDKKCIYKYSLVFVDSKGFPKRKEVGEIYLNKNTPLELKTLNELHFIIGDYLDINIYSN